jgi:hypothetical protein
MISGQFIESNTIKMVRFVFKPFCLLLPLTRSQSVPNPVNIGLHSFCYARNNSFAALVGIYFTHTNFTFLIISRQSSRKAADNQ